MTLQLGEEIGEILVDAVTVELEEVCQAHKVQLRQVILHLAGFAVGVLDAVHNAGSEGDIGLQGILEAGGGSGDTVGLGIQVGELLGILLPFLDFLGEQLVQDTAVIDKVGAAIDKGIGSF